MIDLMEIGRRLWEDGEPLPTEQPASRSRSGDDLMGRENRARVDPADNATLSKSATIRNPSAADESRPSALSANPQNPQPTAPAHEAEAIITALTHWTDRDLGYALVERLRSVLAPMGKTERANLAVAVVEAFEDAQDIEHARQQVAELLDAQTPRQPHRDPLMGRLDWTTWIGERCPLVPEDRSFILRRLHTLPPKAMERAACRYIEIWQAAAENEPASHRKENAGRRAANRSLLALIR